MKVQYSNQTIENETIVLKEGDMNFLGPDVELRGCTIDIQSSTKGVTVVKAKLRDCTIRIAPKAAKLDWYSAHLEGCRFRGEVKDHNFGYSARTPHPVGVVKDCDFTEAQLDGCRFFECDMGAIRLPGWPCFAILSPFEHIDEMKSMGEGVLKRIADYFEFTGAKPVAMVFFGPRVASDAGVEADALQQAIEGVDWIQA